MKVKTKLQNICEYNTKTFCIFVLTLNFTHCFDFRVFCDNKPNVTIDSIVKLDNNSIFVSTQTYYALIESITRDHLPIIADGYPKVIDEDFKQLQIKYNNTSALDYEFVGYQYYWKDRHQNDRKFIGFNQVWMGCPQPLCLQGGIDAILKDEEYDENTLNIQILRGKYFWEIGNYSEPPLVGNARLISEKWETSSQELVFPIDAAFTAWNLNHIFFNKNKTIEFGLGSTQTHINKTFKGIPNDVSAVMYWDTGSIDKEVLFIFKGHRVWSLRNGAIIEGWPKNITDINPYLPIDINAALIDYNDNVFLFKDSYYYTLKAFQLVRNDLLNAEIKPQIVFKHFFNCNDSLYKDWGFESYQQFIHNYYSKDFDSSKFSSDLQISSTFLDKIQQIFLKSDKSDKISSINWVIVLIVFSMIIILSLIGVLVLIYCISKLKKRSETRNIEILTAMRPLMHTNTNRFDIISIDELPKKGKKNGLKLNRTKLSDDAYG